MLVTFNCKTWQWLFNGNLHDTFLKIVNERVMVLLKSLRIIGMLLKGFFFNEFIENILDTFAKE